jgi:transposase InsO family protein
VNLAVAEGANVSELCQRFGISRKTAYKWIARYRGEGVAGLQDRSRRPHLSPEKTATAIEQRVLELRTEHPAWGGRKLRRRLQDLGHIEVPAASTITEILRRHQRLDPETAGEERDWQRFEHPEPNDLWQMDFKGHFSLTRSGRCHPLTVLDDHSRYALGLRACGDECRTTVQAELIRIFRQFGLPRRMSMDNGAPWGYEDGESWTRLTAWLVRLGIRVTHSRPYHPQTQGKDERFHRTLDLEVLRGRSFASLDDCQQTFDPWRMSYNTERPHEALGLATPATRYRCSGREFPEKLSPIEYADDIVVRKVSKGMLSFRGRVIRIGKAFNSEPVGIRPTNKHGCYEVLYCHQILGGFDLNTLPPEPGRITLDTVRIP